MKYLILILVALSLLLTVGCANTHQVPESTANTLTLTEPTESPDATPMPELNPEDQPPAGTDSDLSAPPEGPEGLPTPAL